MSKSPRQFRHPFLEISPEPENFYPRSNDFVDGTTPPSTPAATSHVLHQQEQAETSPQAFQGEEPQTPDLPLPVVLPKLRNNRQPNLFTLPTIRPVELPEQGNNRQPGMFTLPTFRSSQGGRSLGITNRTRPQEILSFDAFDAWDDFDRRDTIPMLAALKPLPDLQDQPRSFVLTEDDLDIDLRPTIPMMVLKGIADREGQPTPVMQSEISGAASDAALIGVGNILGNIFKYTNNLLIQRGLGAGPYGLYSLGSSMVALFISVFNLGLDDAMVRYVAVYRTKKRRDLLLGLSLFCFSLAAIGGTIGGLLMLFFTPALASLRHSPDVVPILVLMAPLIPLSSVQALASSGLQGFKAFKTRIVLQRFIIPGMLTILLVLVLIFFRNLTGVVIAGIISTAASAALNIMIFFQTVARMKGGGAKAYEIREWCSFAIPNFLTSVIDTVLEATDTLLLAYFVFSNVALGQYAAANKLSIFISVPLLTLNVTFAPTIAELFSKGEKQKLAIMFQVVTKWVITFSLPLCLIAMLFSRSLLAISGQSFVDAWPLLLALAVGNMINAGTGPVGYMLMMTGHQKLSFINSLTAVIVNVVLGIILTPLYGALGTAIATGLALAVVNLMRLLQVYVLLKIHPYKWDTIKPLLAGLLAALLIGPLLYPFSFINLPVQFFNKSLPVQLSLVPVFLAVYIGFLVLFKVSPEDKIVLDKLTKKFGFLKRKH